MKSTYLLFLLLLTSMVRAQVSHQTVQLSPGQLVLVAATEPVSSVALRLAEGQSVAGTYLVVAGDTLLLRADSHAPSGQSATVLCVFRQPVTQFTVWSGTVQGAVELTTLHVPPLPPGYVEARMASARAATACDKPTVVPVSVWRVGLLPPKERPVATRVQFVIVHHSAGSNTATNYADEVRNIYTFHTQSNGWNDVGYNFLIGRDGVIYEGRDGQGILDGDNVQGAHFCGQNSGTMGICLMGNFNDIQPTDASLSALKQLIGWKLKKEGIADPTARTFHTGSGKQLSLISGHRDGCATECPGNNVYAKLLAIRAEVAGSCSFTTTAPPVVVVPTPLATDPTATGWTVFPNPGRGAFYVTHPSPHPAQVRFRLLDGLGRQLPLDATPQTTDQWRISLPGATAGLYWLRCADGAEVAVRAVWYSPQ